MGTTNTIIRRASGTTRHNPFHSLWSLTILASSTLERNTLITSSRASNKANINSLKIGQEAYIVAYHSSGTNKRGTSTSQCRETSRKSSTNMDIYSPEGYKRAHTHPNQKHTVQRHRPLYHLMTLNHSTRREYSRFNKSLVVSCTKRKQLTTQY